MDGTQPIYINKYVVFDYFSLFVHFKNVFNIFYEY